MQRLGMTYLYDFDHPALAKNHRLSQHVLYQITRHEFIYSAQTRVKLYIQKQMLIRRTTLSR